VRERVSDRGEAAGNRLQKLILAKGLDAEEHSCIRPFVVCEKHFHVCEVHTDHPGWVLAARFLAEGNSAAEKRQGLTMHLRIGPGEK